MLNFVHMLSALTAWIKEKRQPIPCASFDGEISKSLERKKTLQLNSKGKRAHFFIPLILLSSEEMG